MAVRKALQIRLDDERQERYRAAAEAERGRPVEPGEYFRLSTWARRVLDRAVGLETVGDES